MPTLSCKKQIFSWYIFQISFESLSLRLLEAMALQHICVYWHQMCIFVIVCEKQAGAMQSINKLLYLRVGAPSLVSKTADIVPWVNRLLATWTLAWCFGRSVKSLCLGPPCAQPKLAACSLTNLNAWYKNLFAIA